MRKHRRLLVSVPSLLQVAAMAALAMLFLVSCGGGSDPPTATVSSTAGEAMVQRQGSATWIQATPGMELHEGDRIKTGSSGKAEILFFEGSVVEVSAGSEILLSDLSIGKKGSTSIHINQAVGNTINRVEKLVDSQSHYEVETPAGSAAVRGTLFYSFVGSDGFTVVHCDDGGIWFTAGGVTVAVNEGEWSSAMPEGTPSIPATFHVDNVAVCSDVQGDRDYTVKPDAAFAPGERVWIYFEALALSWNTSNSTFEVWYKVTAVTAYNPDGDVYFSEAREIDFHQTELDSIPNYLWGALYLDLPSGAPAGPYEVELAFQDVISGEIDSVTVHFRVTGAD